jgi:hypothetical protein
LRSRLWAASQLSSCSSDVACWHLASFRCFAATSRLSGQSGLWRGVSPANLWVHGLVAVGIKNKVFDRTVCFNFWSDALVRHTEEARKFIEYKVSSEGGEASYFELRKLSLEWGLKIQKRRKRYQESSNQLSHF